MSVRNTRAQNRAYQEKYRVQRMKSGDKRLNLFLSNDAFQVLQSDIEKISAELDGDGGLTQRQYFERLILDPDSFNNELRKKIESLEEIVVGVKYENEKLKGELASSAVSEKPHPSDAKYTQMTREQLLLETKKLAFWNQRYQNVNEELGEELSRLRGEY